MGDEVVWVLKDTERLQRTGKIRPYRVVPCPVFKPCQRIDTTPPRNLSAIAWNLGLHDADHLRSVVRGWCQIFSRTRPDLVVQDFGLTAGYVARSLGIQTIRIGTGYTCPPRSEAPVDLPWFTKHEMGSEAPRPRSNCPIDRVSRSIFGKVMDNIAAACRANGLSAPSRWDQVVNGCEEDVLATLPLLDPYAEARVPPIWHGVWGGPDSEMGPIRHNDLEGGLTSTHVLAYLKPFAHWKPFFDSLKQLRVRVDLVADGVSREQLRQCDRAWVRVCKGFRSIASAGRRGWVLINNGNHGSTALSLLHGMPVIACPLYFEQRLTAEAIASAGVGVHLDVRFPERFCETLGTGLSRDLYRSRAKRFESRHAKLFLDGGDRVLDRFLGNLA